MAKATISNPLQTLRKLIPFRRPLLIKRSAKTYLKEQGWHLLHEKGKPELHGWYRSKYGSFYGMIQNLDSTKPSFYIRNPPPELTRHPHWACFTPRPDKGAGVYSVHFATVPRDWDSAVLHIQEVLDESFRLAKKTA